MVCMMKLKMKCFFEATQSYGDFYVDLYQALANQNRCMIANEPKKAARGGLSSPKKLRSLYVGIVSLEVFRTECSFRVKERKRITITSLQVRLLFRSIPF